MKKSQDPIVQRKVDLEENPKGTMLKVSQQRDLEENGRYVPVPGDKNHTMIFVRNGDDPEKRIATYLERTFGGITMLRGRTMHVYSRDGDIYYGNVMFRNIEPMTEEEYDKFIKETLEEHFPNLKEKRYCIIWRDNNAKERI